MPRKVNSRRPNGAINRAQWVLLMMAMFAPFASPAQNSPRVTVQIFKYTGVHSTAEQRQFDAFKAIIHAKISSISEELAESEYFGELEHLKPFFPQNSGGDHVPFTGSNADLLQRWRSANSLEIFLGRIADGGDGYTVISRIFLGDLETGLTSRFLSIELPIMDNQYETTRDSHSVAILYALAMDARRRCRPEHEVVELLSKASERLADVPVGVRGMDELRIALQTDLESLQVCTGVGQ